MKMIKFSMKDEFIAGAFAGFVARLLTAPFDVLKIRYQVQSNTDMKYKSLFQSIRTIINEEGFFALWKGNTSATYLWVTYAMVQFSVYSFLLRLYDSISQYYQSNNDNNNNKITLNNNKMKRSNNGYNDNNKWNTIRLFIAGAGAGIMATLATYPFDLMRTQFALQGNNKAYNNMASFITHTIKDKGPLALYAGLTPAIVGITPYMGLNFLIYETMNKVNEKILIENDPSELMTIKNKPAIGKGIKKMLRKALYGGIAGGTSKFLVYPFDTVKKRMQISSLNVLDSSVISKYGNLWMCISSTITKEGFPGFYRGIKPTILKAIAASSITFAAYETAKEVLAARKEKDKDNTSNNNNNNNNNNDKNNINKKIKKQQE